MWMTVVVVLEQEDWQRRSVIIRQGVPTGATRRQTFVHRLRLRSKRLVQLPGEHH